VLWMRERGTLAQEGKIERVTADPDDGYLVALSKASGADLIVSEDHLVELEGEDLRRVV
jgi:predicted nucleic acid-binding protein